MNKALQTVATFQAKKVLQIASLTAVLTIALPACAQGYEAGDWVIRAGATQVAPAESSSALTLDGTVLPPPLSGNLKVDDDTQLGLTVEYMISNNWGIELLAATPFSHTATVTSATTLQGLDAADIKHLPPTLSVVYHIGTGSNFQPYLGVGINYTVFFDEEITSTADATFSTLGLTGGDVEMDNAWGASFQVGFDYHLNKNWLINASVRWIDIDSTATIKFDSGSDIESDIEIDPYVYTLSVGYKF